MAKRAISYLPELTASNTSSRDPLIIVNSNITKRISVNELFTAGFGRSTNNIISASTSVAGLLYVDKSIGSVAIGGEPVPEFKLMSYGSVGVDSGYKFVTDYGNSDNWNDTYSEVNSLLIGTRNVLISHLDIDNTIKNKAYKIIDSTSIGVLYNDDNNTVQFRTSNTTLSVSTDIALDYHWLLSSGANSGISIDQTHNTISIAPHNHGKTYGIGSASSGKTHVRDYTATIWGDVYIGGKITTADISGTIAGFGFGNMASQNSANVSITGGSISGVSITGASFTSLGISDLATSSLLYLSPSNKIGIGIPEPTEKFEVDGKIKATDIIINNQTPGGYGTVSVTGKGGSYINIYQKTNEVDTALGIKIHTTGLVNTFSWPTNQNLFFSTSDSTVRAVLTQSGRFGLGASQSPIVNFQTTGSDEYIRSSIALVNTRTTNDSFSNVYFGNNAASVTGWSWIKFQHYSNGTPLNSMIFGILDNEKMRINSDNSVEFKNVAGVTKMKWDGISELKINDNKVWHLGNDGTGSGLDADVLDGQQGSWYSNWANITNKPSPVITLSGDATGSVTLSELTSGSIEVVVVNNSHTHDSTSITYAGLNADTCDGQHLGTTANVTFNNVTVNGTLTESSDRRLKENIVPIIGALDVINKITGVRYNKIDNPNQTEIGFIAQEIEEYLPEVVQTDANGFKSINYTRIVALLVEAIKELKNKIN
jgi:hypothetical protein